MGNAKEERKVFINFLKARPMFAGSRVLDWRQPQQDPPDIEVDLEDGRKVALELTSWLDEDQIREAKQGELIRRRSVMLFSPSRRI